MFPLSSIYQHFPLENTSETGDHDHDPDQNPNSSNGQDQLPYSDFPTILEDDGLLLSHLLSQQQLILSGNTNSQTDEISVVASNRAALDNHHHHHGDLHGNPDGENPSKLGFLKKQRAKAKSAVPRRTRTGKKDRHSKISTAQGLRDRRMRLSLQIARKFFDLQDMLGFDKASKTIEWLITKSKTAIKELKHSLAKQNCTSSTSEGEVVSKTAEKEGGEDRDRALIRLRREKKAGKVHNPIARESRDKARARARERTREKILEKSRHGSSASEATNINNGDLGKLRASISTSLDSQREMESSTLKVMVASSSFDQEELKDQTFLDYSMSNHVGVSSGANSEDDFLGFPCGIFSTTLSSSDTEEYKPGSFFPVTTPSNAQRQNPSSVYGTTLSNTLVEQNPCSVFMGTTATGRNYGATGQNPRPVFTTTSNIVRQGQNPTSNFVIGTCAANTFCSNF